MAGGGRPDGADPGQQSVRSPAGHRHQKDHKQPADPRGAAGVPPAAQRLPRRRNIAAGKTRKPIGMFGVTRNTC